MAQSRLGQGTTGEPIPVDPSIHAGNQAAVAKLAVIEEQKSRRRGRYIAGGKIAGGILMLAAHGFAIKTIADVPPVTTHLSNDGKTITSERATHYGVNVSDRVTFDPTTHQQHQESLGVTGVSEAGAIILGLAAVDLAFVAGVTTATHDAEKQEFLQQLRDLQAQQIQHP